MRYVVRSIHPWVTLAVIAVLCFASWLVSSQTLLVTTNSFLLVVSAVVGVAFTGQAIRYMRGRDKGFQRLDPEEQARAQHISYGIALAWIDTAIWRCIIMVWLL